MGRDLPLRSFKDHYNAIVFAYGASADRKLGIPGEEDLKGIYSARAFVGWYNGLPEYGNLAPDLSGEEAVIIGQGNVALDIARTLLSPIDRLRATDMTDQALAALAKSNIKHVRVVGRRGPMQASFTIKEVRELMTLHDVGFSSIDLDLLPIVGTTLPRAQKRLMDLLRKASSHSSQPPDANTPGTRSWGLDFLLSPKSFNPAADNSRRLSSVTFTKNHLQGPDPFDPSARALGTYPEEQITLPASTAFRSIGYRSEPLPGMVSDLSIDFDPHKGIIVNDGVGRALSPRDPSTNNNNSNPPPPTTPLPGIYCAGWVKRGPTGVIAGTMEDAFATAEALVHDWQHAKNSNNKNNSNSREQGGVRFLGGDGQGWDALQRQIRPGKRTISWEDWRVIDRAERERGKRVGKEREKFGGVEEMLEVL